MRVSAESGDEHWVDAAVANDREDVDLGPLSGYNRDNADSKNSRSRRLQEAAAADAFAGAGGDVAELWRVVVAYELSFVNVSDGFEHAWAAKDFIDAGERSGSFERELNTTLNSEFQKAAVEAAL